MQIVIKISDRQYELLQRVAKTKRGMENLSEYGELILNGTPLPKGHGKIGDLDALREEVSSWGMNDYEPLDFIDAIDEADTIIEADTEGSGEE